MAKTAVAAAVAAVIKCNAGVISGVASPAHLPEFAEKSGLTG